MSQKMLTQQLRFLEKIYL
ncbi:hypothetical protein MCG43_05925 [Romboutsia hominis]|nr:hypothetical protein [Paeniclostridium sordellii]MCH1959475.1 hypothetical protein [Romboutsia hominis]